MVFGQIRGFLSSSHTWTLRALTSEKPKQTEHFLIRTFLNESSSLLPPLRQESEPLSSSS
jgi:hypothetical protein